MVYKQNKHAAQGIGTLIIFIAFILVAAVSAGVLIQTASSLQSKSLDVGRQSQEKITTDVEIVQVLAVGTSDGAITASTDNVTIVVRLGSGSAAVRLSDLLIRLDTQSGTQSLTYNGTANFNTATYGVTYKINGTNHANDYLTTGDLAEITFTSTLTISEGQSATLRLIPKNGAVKPVDLTTPSSMIQTITYLYP